MIELDKDVVWNYGLRTRNGGEWGKHDKRNVFGIRINSDGTIASELDVTKLDLSSYNEKMNMLGFHGSMQWIIWYILGFVIIASKRYLQGYAVYAMNLIHVICGFICIVFTLVAGFGILSKIGWQASPHAYMGVVVMSLCIVELITGDITLLLDKCRGNKPWHASGDKKLIALIHRWGGYTLLLLSHL